LLNLYCFIFKQFNFFIIMKNFETGHAKNVTNFYSLITAVSSFGPSYAPKRSDLTIAALNSKVSSCDAGVSNTNSQFSDNKIHLGNRELTFSLLSSKAHRIQAAVKASDVKASDLDNIITVVRKICGQRAVPKHPASTADPNAPPVNPLATPADSVPRNISVSQMSYDSRLANLDILIKLLITLPAYDPGSAELTIAALTVDYKLMLKQNNAVISSNQALDKSRGIRNQELYAPKTGMVTIASDVKSYVKAQYTAKSIEYKAVAAIKFKSQKR
jgi:hypothetical protein